VLNVAGHERLQEAFCVEQFATHASEDASANLNLLAPVVPSFANTVPKSVIKAVVAKVNLMGVS
jgi:hypothetical protein